MPNAINYPLYMFDFYLWLRKYYILISISGCAINKKFTAIKALRYRPYIANLPKHRSPAVAFIWQ